MAAEVAAVAEEVAAAEVAAEVAAASEEVTAAEVPTALDDFGAAEVAAAAEEVPVALAREMNVPPSTVLFAAPSTFAFLGTMSLNSSY